MAVITAFNEGGPFMYFILVFGILTFSVLVERGFVLYAKTKSAGKGFRQQVLNFLSKGDFRGAEGYARSAAGNTAIGRIVAVGCALRGNASGDEDFKYR